MNNCDVCRVCGYQLTKNNKMGCYCCFCYVLIDQSLISYDSEKITAKNNYNLSYISMNELNKRNTLISMYPEYSEYGSV
jgi:hypothetical protein